MNKKKRSAAKISTACLLSLMVLLAFTLPSLSQNQNIDKYEKELKDIAERINSLQRLLRQEEKKETTILAQLERIGIRKELIRKEIDLHQTKLKMAEEELAETQLRIEELRRQLDKEKEAIIRVLKTLYKFGRLSYAHLFLQVKDMGSLITGNKHLALLAQSQDRVIESYGSALTELHNSEQTQETNRSTINDLLSGALDKRNELARTERENQRLISEIEENKGSHQRTLSELSKRAQDLQNLIKDLVEAQSTLPFTPVPLMEVKGKLEWPMDGRVTSRFGLQTHPRFKTVTKNNGIEISPRASNLVKAIHPATVAYSDYFQGYGNLIILDHGLKYYSLYGHCSDFMVKKGDVVQTGQPIATVGDLGSLRGDSLYFEIRFKTQPLNPLQWLKRK